MFWRNLQTCSENEGAQTCRSQSLDLQTAARFCFAPEPEHTTTVINLPSAHWTHKWAASPRQPTSIMCWHIRWRASPRIVSGWGACCYELLCWPCVVFGLFLCRRPFGVRHASLALDCGDTIQIFKKFDLVSQTWYASAIRSLVLGVHARRTVVF